MRFCTHRLVPHHTPAPRAATPTETAPVVPSGHGNIANGKPAQKVATVAIQAVNQAATSARLAAVAGHQTPAIVAATPSSVAGGTAGVANTLARIPCVGNPGARSSSTGAQTSCAEAETAAPIATGSGQNRRSRWANTGANANKPPVATTDSTKPKSRANHGSNPRSTTTAANKAGMEDRGRPVARPSSNSPPMTPARTTEPEG